MKNNNYNKFKEMCEDNNEYIYNAILNRVRFCEEHINDDEPYMRIGCRHELEFYIKFKEKFDLNFSFQHGIIKIINKHIEYKKQIGL